MNDSDQLKTFLRTQWFSFVKWTTGLSTLLMTVSLTILIRISINECAKRILFVMVLVLIVEIISSWALLHYAIVRVYKPMVDGTIKENVFVKKLNTVEKLEVCTFALFILGIVLFTYFLVSTLFN